MTSVENSAKEVPITDFATHAKRRAWFVVLLAGLVLFGVVVGVGDPQRHDLLPHGPFRAAPRRGHAGCRSSAHARRARRATRADRAPGAQQRRDAPAFGRGRQCRIDRRHLARHHRAPGSTYSTRPCGVRTDRRRRRQPGLHHRGLALRDGSYPGYNLSTLGTDGTRDRPFPPSAAAVVLSLVFGALLGFALLFLDWSFHRLAVPTGAPRLVVGEPEPAPRARGSRLRGVRAKPAARKPRATNPRPRKPPGAKKATGGAKTTGTTKQTRTRSTRTAKASSEPQTDLQPPNLPSRSTGTDTRRRTRTAPTPTAPATPAPAPRPRPTATAAPTSTSARTPAPTATRRRHRQRQRSRRHQP